MNTIINTRLQNQEKYFSLIIKDFICILHQEPDRCLSNYKNVKKKLNTLELNFQLSRVEDFYI